MKIKWLLFSFSLFGCLFGHAQLVLLAEDNPPYKTADGYRDGVLLDNVAQNGSTYYFYSPNGNFYQSDGTVAGTKVIKKMSAVQLVYFLAATNRYLYFTQSSGSGSQLCRLQLSSGLFEGVTLGSRREKIIMQPGFSKIYVSPAKDRALIRVFDKGNTTVYSIGDDQSAYDTEVVIVRLDGTKDQFINPLSELGLLRNQVFFNGSATDSAEKRETIVASCVPVGNGYALRTYDKLRKNGVDFHTGFYTLQDSLHVLAYYKDKKDRTAKEELILIQTHETTNTVVSSMPVPESPCSGEQVGAKLYVTCGKQLWRWVPADKIFEKVLTNPGKYFATINSPRRIYEVDGCIVYGDGDSIRVFNEATRQTKVFVNPSIIKEENSLYKFVNRSVYATSKHLYYTAIRNGSPTLIQYTPSTGQESLVAFPEEKKETFKAFRCLLQKEDQFFIFTEYADKKDRPVYKVFGLKD